MPGYLDMLVAFEEAAPAGLALALQESHECTDEQLRSLLKPGL